MEKAAIKTVEKSAELIIGDNEDEENVAEDENFFEMEHTLIDFRYLILGQKLQIWKKDPHSNYIFDDFELAKLIDSVSHHTELFTKSSIQKIVDYQF